jgi:tRNA-uridine 2-sulfurtransferase
MTHAPERWVVAMSGGVDSSVAAALLVREGVSVVGITMDLGSAPSAAPASGKRCCGLPDVSDARAVARSLGIRHYTANYRREFRDAVIDPFVAVYRAGRTPIPCVACNRVLKFDVLLRRAEALGCAGVASGHYARIAAGPDGAPSLLRPRDREKDQTYFLFDLPRAVLQRVRFPLGDLSKPQVRAIARELALATADKPESQGICFVPDGDVRAALERLGAGPRDGESRTAGDGAIVDCAGRVLGRHAGAAGYTVGQRRGLGLAGGPWYVIAVDVAANRVVVERARENLQRKLVEIEGAHWIDGDAPDGPVRVQIRHRHRAVLASVQVRAGSSARIVADEPLWAPAPGQAAVVYDADDERVLGGGWITASA